MKKLLLFLLLLFSLQNYAFSQRISFINQSSYFMIGPTYSNWADYPDEIEMKSAGNRGLDILGMYHGRLAGDALGLNIGIGYSNVNIHTNVAAWSFTDSGSISPELLMKEGYSRNKLSLSYLEVPLELTFRTKAPEEKKNRVFKVAIGFRGGLCIDAHTKTNIDGDKYKVKSFDNIGRLRYGPTARIGYGLFSLYARYDLSSTFDAAAAPDYNLYSVGIMISKY